MSPTMPSWTQTALFVGFIGLALYRRVRRSIGRQLVAPKRMVLRMAFLAAVAGAFLLYLPTVAGVSSAALGGVLGGALAAYGLIHTRYDATPEGTYYTPNKWIGMVVVALLLGRLAARVLSLYEAKDLLTSAPPPDAALQRSPLTLGLFFLMAAYYMVYYAGVLRKARSLALPRPASPSS